jgi:hypothetical protein
MMVLTLAVMGACASGGGAPGTSDAGRPETMRVVGGAGIGSGSAVTMNAGATASVTKIAFPIEQVWRTLPAAYDSLKIPLTVLDPKTHHIGNVGLKIRQRLGNVALSKYIDCGDAQIGPSADSYDVFLNVTTTLTATSGAETAISTIVESAAKPLSFGQEYSRCSSKGTIENAIAAMVASRLMPK